MEERVIDEEDEWGYATSLWETCVRENVFVRKNNKMNQIDETTSSFCLVYFVFNKVLAYMASSNFKEKWHILGQQSQR
jgi:hypothetical protein